jgi:UDP-2,4-diacetamido-2,4,6-trideoxy-beta-L-altropyranose hydrolase
MTSRGGCLRNPDPNIAIRVDATSQIGAGHFMRCLALADTLRERGGHVQFVGRWIPDRMRELAIGNGHRVAVLPPAPGSGPLDELAHAHWLGTSQRADAELTIEALAGKRVDWLIVDHYALDARWEAALRKAAANILVIDDLADRVHDCDVLLDQNLHDDMPARYATRVPADCRLLLGPKYALLREEFRGVRAAMRLRDGAVRRVLILMGGMDLGNFTARAIDAVSRLALPLDVDAIVGTNHPAREEIAAACNKLGYKLHVQPSNVARLMEAADLAVGAGGSTTWERCCLGLPTLVLCVAENQKSLVADCALRGLVYAPGLRGDVTESIAAHLRSLLDNPLLLQAMSRNGLRAVDGRGTQRVLLALGYGAITVREATQSDSGQVYAWRNHPEIRDASGNPAPIDRSIHEKWFASVLADPDRLLLLGVHGGRDIGVVRFDVRSSETEVSIYLAPGLAGEGRGAELLHAAESWLSSNRPDVRVLRARVLRNNQSSQGLFAACGYRKDSILYAKEVNRI